VRDCPVRVRLGPADRVERWSCARPVYPNLLTRALPERTRGSLRFYPELLNERPPFFGIGLHKRAKRLRCLSLARENFVPQFGEP
jgi:hypothetical protein